MIYSKFRVLYDGEGNANPLANPPPANTPPANTSAPTIADDFDFRAFLPDDVKDHPSFAKITGKGKEGIAALGRSFVHAQHLVGKDPSRLVEIPEKLEGDARRELLGKMGLPKDASGYKLEPVSDVLPQFAPDQPLSKSMIGWAAELGIFPDQAQGLYERFTREMTAVAKKQQADMTAADQTSIEGLKKEWGDAYDPNVRAANLAIEKLGGDELRNALNDAGLGANAVVVKALAQVGKMFAEAGGGGDKTGVSPTSGMTPAEAKAKGMELLAQALDEKNQFKKAKLNEEAQKYFKIAAGNATVK